MGAFCAFLVGVAAGWFGHQYRSKLAKVKAVVSEEFKKS